MPVETEIKLRLRGAVGEVAAELARLGYHADGPRLLESDQLYDRPDGELRRGDRLLRLRSSGGRSTVTYKGPAARAPYKSREELEVVVSDGTTFARVLEVLGYEPVFYYEKYRTKFRPGTLSGLVTLDETPIGNFLELEGPEDWIDATAAQLGYAARDYITASYGSLYRDHCQTRGGVPSAMRF